MTSSLDIKAYYRKITEVSIESVVKNLISDRITEETKDVLHCDCPRHNSISAKSLHINLYTQSWYCFGCGKGGDVIHLVEFIQTGNITTHHKGLMPDSHKQARDYLAAMVGLPKLSESGLNVEDIKRIENNRQESERIKTLLTEASEFYCEELKKNKEISKWFKSFYSIDDETIDKLKIGFATNPNGLVKYLRNCERKYTPAEMQASGLFKISFDNDYYPFFKNRLVFPYFKNGMVAYAIGRKTPLTPNDEYEKAKYKKLPVWNKHSNKLVSQTIHNDILFNEDCLINNDEYVVISEGITDCISLIQRDIMSISPVTVRIKKEDWEKIIPKIKKVKVVYICQDNEISGAGLSGALETADVLLKENIIVKIIELPLNKKQGMARFDLHDNHEIDEGIKPKELKAKLDKLSPDDKAKVQGLIADAKIDINDYFLDHSGDDFLKLMEESLSPIELAISKIDPSDKERATIQLKEVLTNATGITEPLLQDDILSRVADKLKGTYSKQAIIKTFNSIKKSSRGVGSSALVPIDNNAPDGSCLTVIAKSINDSIVTIGKVDYKMVAESAFKWFADNGAHFFYTTANRPYMCFENEIFYMDSQDPGAKRFYLSMMQRVTGLINTSANGRTFFEVLANLAMTHGKMLDHLSWLHTNIRGNAVYFNLNNENHDVAKITPDGVEIIKNGNNDDDIILENSSKQQPITFIPDADIEKADNLIEELITSQMTCSRQNKDFVILWLLTFLLMDYSGTKPMMRFEGTSGSGKTTATKLLTTLIYGQPQQKKSSDAANYTDGRKNPLIALDNIETRDMTDEQTNFMLTSVTGISKEKRKMGTDSETIIEQTKCLITSTGIEPLKGELTEIQTRTLTVNFHSKNQNGECFIESDLINEIRENRDYILSAVMKKTSIVLKMIQEGRRKDIIKLLNSSLGNHDKKRCNEYFSIMYLFDLVIPYQKNYIDRVISTLNPGFKIQVDSLNHNSQNISKDTNHIASALNLIFNAWKEVLSGDDTDYNIKSNAANLRAKYMVTITQNGDTKELSLTNILSKDLFPALSRISREFQVKFDVSSSRQLSQRMANDIDIIKSAGFKVDITLDKNRTKLYTFTK